MELQISIRSNDYLKAAVDGVRAARREGLSLWDELRRAMKTRNLDPSKPHEVFLVGRYAGQILERDGASHLRLEGSP